MISKLTKYDDSFNVTYLEVRVCGGDVKDLIQYGLKHVKDQFSSSEWFLIQQGSIEESTDYSGTTLNLSLDGTTLLLKYAEDVPHAY
jgi:hypothetical protein